MTGMGSDVMVIRGWATVPARLCGPITITWPSAWLQTDDRGIQVDLTVSSKIPAFEPTAGAHLWPFTWTCQWSERAWALAAEYSIVFMAKSGRGCRFVAHEAWRARLLFDLVESHGIHPQGAIHTAYLIGRI